MTKTEKTEREAEARMTEALKAVGWKATPVKGVSDRNEYEYEYQVILSPEGSGITMQDRKWAEAEKGPWIRAGGSWPEKRRGELFTAALADLDGKKRPDGKKGRSIRPYYSPEAQNLRSESFNELILKIAASGGNGFSRETLEENAI